jgi:phosphorylcholine metabolism protein LicD
MDKVLAIRNLTAVKEVFEKFGITLWLDFGTLLGAVREGRLIEWDLDIDLATWDRDRKKILWALKNLKEGQSKAKVDVGAPLFPNFHDTHVSLYPYDSTIEIFLYQVRNNKAINVFSVNQNFLHNI